MASSFFASFNQHYSSAIISNRNFPIRCSNAPVLRCILSVNKNIIFIPNFTVRSNDFPCFKMISRQELPKFLYLDNLGVWMGDRKKGKKLKRKGLIGHGLCYIKGDFSTVS